MSRGVWRAVAGTAVLRLTPPTPSHASSSHPTHPPHFLHALPPTHARYAATPYSATRSAVLRAGMVLPECGTELGYGGMGVPEVDVEEHARPAPLRYPPTRMP
eukprot:2718664-Rhodomonas_salina.1